MASRAGELPIVVNSFPRLVHMAAPQYVKLERVMLKGHPSLDERWVQARIAEDPAILGLGELTLKDKERQQPRGGRLDLLLQDPETLRRYEVEVQLGRTDETHIIRTIEYWDIERKRYPQYDHCAVLVAEDISSRFLNVIGLFNGSIPLIAVQMQALRLGDRVSLVFTTVLDELARGLEEEDGDEQPTNRSYWEERASKPMLSLVDELWKIVHELDGTLDLKYNKHYIGITREGQPYNFVAFVPRKNAVQIELALDESEDVSEKFSAAGFDAVKVRRGRYRVRVTADDVRTQRVALFDLMKLAHDRWNA